MDRPLSDHTIKSKRRKLVIQVCLVIGGITLLFFAFSAWISPSVNRKDIQTAFVQRGTIEGSISASGTIIPRSEEAISSPAETRIIAVLKKPGTAVKKGESLLDLDKNEVKLSLDQTEKELALKENSRKELNGQMEKTLGDLKNQLNIKELNLKYLQSKSAQGEKMLTLGAVSKDQYDQMKLEEQIAGIEKTGIEQSIQSTTQSLHNQLDGISTEVNTLVKEKTDIQRQLEMLSCYAGQDGVVTWVNEQIGTSVHRGDILARVADLTSYRVEATVSDIHTSELIIGMPAKIRLNETNFSGRVQTVYPTIQDGTAKFDVSIDDSTANVLRPNLRVDVDLITSMHENTLKVKKGAFLKGQQVQPVFVIRGTTAQRVEAKIGVISFDEVELLSGVSAGDELIISDISEIENLTQLKVK